MLRFSRDGMRMMRGFVFGAIVPLLVTSPLIAQVDSIPGVTLGLLYESEFQPALAVQPFLGSLGGESVASQVEAIIARDLRYSDRFEVMDALPGSLVGDGVDYQLWDQLGAVWLVSGSLERADPGFVLVLELHDVVYGEVHEQGRFQVPSPDDEDFRLAVHIASDAVIEWIYNEPGMAASRIAFSLRTTQGNQDLYLIDSDGENFRRLTNYDDLTMSPSWSPDGKRIAFSSRKTTGLPRIFELDLETSGDKMLDAGRDGDHNTPIYSPNGRDVTFSITGGNRSGIFSYDMERGCCLTHLSGGRWDDISPTYSPDGRRLAFNSNRLGTQYPQIYVMSSTGGEADLVSPYLFGQGGYYTSPDWAPVGDHVAFHGRLTDGQRGRFNILVADVADQGRRLRQLTWEGNNEEPSWAPDGRHLVFVGDRDWGTGLMVVDTATGTYRMLRRGIDVRVPDWSPSLGWAGLR